ncbi:hypothetical protein THOM_2052 [Trachipleistophora hominis]|uniref:Uncharacterized protein n=1 Tax=Trachipleistophora hominis TaxID=72359 RepID=L7JUL5_TRAHO|nr:hypothetical protein THOM_2052 [Trachipleistophora hominis]
MRKKLSLLISELSTILEDSFTLSKYPRPRTKMAFNFLKFADDSIRLFLITVCVRKKNYYIVFDSTIYCYAFYDEFIPMDKRIMVWGRVYGGKWMIIMQWKYIDAKKICYDFF